jgi:hypothetical protein
MPYQWRHCWKWLFERNWHLSHKRLARLRAAYWWVIRLYPTEICKCCGAPVNLVFHVPDAIWAQVTGYGERSPGGESAPGILCPNCVNDLAQDMGIFLRWTCTTDDSVLVG